MEQVVKCKDYSSPFSLRLFSSALHAALEGSEKSQPKDTGRKSIDRSSLSEEAQKEGNEFNETTSHCEDSTKNKPKPLCSETDVQRQEEKLDATYNTEVLDRSLNKKKFFSSSSADSESDEDDSRTGHPKAEFKTIKSTSETTETQSTKKPGNVVPENDKELCALLRLANRSLTVENKNSSDENVEGKKVKESQKKPTKNAEDSLLDFMNEGDPEENIAEVDNENSCEKQKEDLESQMNNEVKTAFLLSSSEGNETDGSDKDGAGHRKKESLKKTRRKIKQELSNETAEENKPKEKNRYKKWDRLSVEICTSEEEGDDDEGYDYDSDYVNIDIDDDDDDDEDDDEDDDDDDIGDDDDDKIEDGNTHARASGRNSQKSANQTVYEEVSLPSGSSDSDIQQVSVVKSKGSPIKGRRNINKIIRNDSLGVGTKAARKLEIERKKRLEERRKMLEEFLAKSNATLVLDFDVKTQKELVVVDSKLCSKLKPHQREGVRFMWDSCFESLERMERDGGSGCILAHCMGLGKTLQIITLIHTILTHHIGIHSVLILCPLNTVRNWMKEFKMWLAGCRRKVLTFEIISCKTKKERADKIKYWANLGGVLIMSYELFRSLMNEKRPENRIFLPALLDPGPDLVICDEGHLLKNMKTALSKCISRIRTLRRIVLTGTPLQNNLIEYYCMVQFVKPNILGTMKEFLNGFVNPIKNGQFEDSTEADVRIMKRRAHVLHSLLDGFIQRLGYSVLTPLLPEKQEYVISISLTNTQDQLYRMFVRNCSSRGESGSLLKDFHWLQKVWTHPRVMLKACEKRKLDDEYATNPDKMFENWGKYVGKDEYDDLNSSGKLILLFKILKICQKIGDKILVFSQNLSTLNLIEHFLKQANESHKRGNQNHPFVNSWVFGQDYFRIDGSTNSQTRFEYCKKFNDFSQNRPRLMLISTRAGGMGINLIGANRVIVFDVSWNPSHDLQSIFRVYRFGQTKPCYIYRFLADATMEEKIYKRQVTKLSLGLRIVDELQIERHYSMMNLHELYSYNPMSKDQRKIPNVPKDSLLAELLVSNRDIIVGYHEHDSLLENKEEEELTKEERRAAWEDFEKDRFNLSMGFGMEFDQTNVQYSAVNQEALKLVSIYKKGLGVPPAHKSLVFQNQSQNQMCKIVDVRTLNNPQAQMAQTSQQVRHQATIDIDHNYIFMRRPSETGQPYALPHQNQNQETYYIEE